MSKRRHRNKAVARRETSSALVRSQKEKDRISQICTERPEVEVGTGNVFADLGFPDADELHLKAALAVKVARLFESRRLSLTTAAEVLETTPEKNHGLEKLQGRKPLDSRVDELLFDPGTSRRFGMIAT
jgi:predicted XRE-type DNA-binding protein